MRHFLDRLKVYHRAHEREREFTMSHYADIYEAGDTAAASRDALRNLVPLADEWVRACDARTDAAWDAAHVASAENVNALALATTRVRATRGAYRDALARVAP